MKPHSPKTQSRPYTEIPGPSQLPWLGNAVSFMKQNRLDWIGSLHKDYGPLVRVKLFSENVIIVHDPDWIQYILQTQYKDFSKEGKAIDKGRAVLGNGIFTSDGEFWRRQRRLAQPAFYHRKLEGLATIMVDCIAEMLAVWEQVANEERVIDIAQEMMRLTLNVVTRSMFSASLKEEDFALFAKSFPSILRETNRRILNPFPLLDRVPVKDSMDYDKNIQELDRIIFRMIGERSDSGEEYDDLLGMLMAARDEESGTGMSEKQLRDEVMTIFIAGHETTAQALSWALYLLHRHLEVRDKLEGEADSLRGDRLPGFADFMGLPYTQKVFKETLRLYPPVAMYPRGVVKAFEMEGYHIPTDVRLIIPPYMMHRHPDHWEEPDRFDPDRFTAEAEKDRHKFVYFPFGGGPRICIGNNFATVEAVLALAMITRKFRVEPVAPGEVEVDFTLTLRPKGGLPSRVFLRN